MVKKNDRRKKDIKSKLIAAICMLLVSSIMMVSSTYAWFTLSTAPEVTGITTVIGSNGNLEIALMPGNGDPNGVGNWAINSNVANDMQWYNRNQTWGNLLNLSDSVYNLSRFTLAPSALQATLVDGKWKLNSDYPLGTQTTGSDGRPDILAGTTAQIGGSKDANENIGVYVPNGLYGVRPVGSASGLTQEQINFNAHKNAIKTYAEAAVRAANGSLSTNGQALASMLVAHAQDTANDKNNYAQYADDLVVLTEALIESINAMYDSVHAALLLSAVALGDGYTNAVESVIKESLTAGENDITKKEALADILDSLTDLGLNTTAVNALSGVKTSIDAIEVNVLAAYNAANTLNAEINVDKTKTEATWADVNAVVGKLMNTSNASAVTINGYELGQIKQWVDDGNFDAIMKLAQNCVISLNEGSGLYYDIAKVAGNIGAAVEDAQLTASLGGKDITTSIDATIKTTAPTPAALISMRDNVAAAVETAMNSGSGEGTGSSVVPMDTFYAYIVDLVFRTNAADANLMLQTDPAQRIYDEVDNEATQGNGARFVYVVTQEQPKALTKGADESKEDYDARVAEELKRVQDEANMKVTTISNLMKNLRVAFFDPTSGSNEIYGIAKVFAPAIETATTTGENGVSTTTYTITGELYMCTLSTDAGGNLVIGDKKQDDVATLETDESALICALDQNIAKAVSALVYLEGANVTNADLLADESVVGTLNLQFATDVDLEASRDNGLYGSGEENT